MTETVRITGGAGVTGSHVAGELRRSGDRVRPLDDSARALLGSEPAVTPDDAIEELAERLAGQAATDRAGAATNEFVARGPAP